MSSQRSRMSLGGGALRRGVLDGSSRYNVRPTAASDDEYLTTPKKSFSSRQSLGGEGLLSRSNYSVGSSSSSIVDRRAMLEKWRQSRNGGGASVDTSGDAASMETRKRNRGDPPLPPVSKQHKSSSSTHGYHSQTNSQDNSIEYYDDDVENRNGGYGGSVLSSRTPASKSNRRMTMGSARRKAPLLGRTVIQNNREGKTWAHTENFAFFPNIFQCSYFRRSSSD